MRYVVFIFFICFNLYSQDESLLRSEFLSNQFSKKVTGSKPKFFQRSSLYKINLNSDHLLEGISFIKKDGKDYIELLNSSNKLLFKFEFAAVGINSRLFKIKFKKIKYQNILLLYYYEGEVNGLEKRSSVRLYLLAFKKNLKQFKVTKGPIIWKGYKTYLNNYFEKEFKVKILDSNQDQLLDIYLESPNIHNVILQKKNLKWLSL